MNRISHLPEPIVHHILHYLIHVFSPPKDLVRMSVLSKNWFALTASFPVLDFDILAFRTPESFFKYVEYTASRFCLQKKNNVTTVFKLFTSLRKPAEFDTINRCLDLVLQNGVREMEISVCKSSFMPKYPLPNTLLSVVSVLKSLSIRRCELPSSLMVAAVKFKSLIRLTLQSVQTDDEVIEHLITSCPLLQELKIFTCRGFKSLCVYGHQNLQNVYIKYKAPLERIDIEAPNLSRIWVDDVCNSGPPRINLVSCKRLTTVAYFGCSLPNNFLSNFPFIEKLCLGDAHCKLNNLELSSHSLKTLVLQSGCDLNEIELNTPNLVLFSFFVGPLWAMPDEACYSSGNSTHLKACMRCYHNGTGFIDALWLQKLRLFFEKKNGFKALNLYIHTSLKFTKLEELNEIKLPLYELEHVELRLPTKKESSNHVAFVAAVLMFFSPQSLTLRSSFPLSDSSGEHGDDVVKLICEKLSQQGDQGHTSIQVAVSNEGKTISFIKKEESG